VFLETRDTFVQAMNPFEFFSVPRVVFGQGSCARLGALASALGTSAMVISNAGEPGDRRLLDRLLPLLDEQHVAWHFWRQSGEPQIPHVEQALTIARQGNCNLVIGIGGGSAIDVAKAVAGLLTNGGGPLDYMEVVGLGRALDRPAAPWIAIPTTAGTGAEVTRNAVIGHPERRFKASLRSPNLLATIALVDSELSRDVLQEVTACSGMDALCQLIESYTSIQSNPLCDALALQGIELALRSIRRAYAQRVDLAARDDMALAALLSGITLTNAGLGAVHGFAAPLGAHLPIPHGAICAALLPHVMSANADALMQESPEHPALAKYATIGRMCAGQADLPATIAIETAIGGIIELSEYLSIPRLAQFGLTSTHIPELVDLARKASSMRFNPAVLADSALADVLRKAL
jgi:alcohol dehydrogenase class IV